MAATVTDKFKKYSDGSDAPSVARVASPRSAAGTTLACDDLTGWATDTAVNFATYELDTADEVVSGSITYWVGVVSGNNLTNVARVKGAADGGNAINDVVVQIPDSDRFDDLVDGLLVSLDQDGTLKAGAVDNAAALASNVVTTAKVLDANVTSAKIDWSTVGVAGGSFTSETSPLAITGLGFQPREVEFTFETAMATTGAYYSSGFSIRGEGGASDVHRATAIYVGNNDTSRRNSSQAYSVLATNATSDIVQGKVTAWGSDGFTITFATAGGVSDRFSWKARE